MVQIKYSGNGMSSRGHDFSPTKNDGFFDVSKEDSEYFLETFPKQFELIKKVTLDEGVKPRARKPRKKSTDVSE